MAETARPSPIRPTDSGARALARSLMDGARFGALGVLDPATGMPMVSRVAVGMDAQGMPLTLVSDLSHHTRALAASPLCSLLVGEPGANGDPLTHPRLTLHCKASRVEKSAALRALWLAQHPKARLYIDFADFNFLALEVHEAHLNGGFGKAYTLAAADLRSG